MKEGRYYTPTIDEFHAGFEYEYPSAYDEGGLGEEVYYRAVFQFDKRIEITESFCANKRVKRVDKEDIESLGFKLNKEHPSLMELGSPEYVDYEFHSKQFGLDYKLLCVNWFTYPTASKGSLEEKIVSGEAVEHRLVKIQCKHTGSFEFQTVFSGDCKNKSELKKILKMIGYDYGKKIVGNL